MCYYINKKGKIMKSYKVNKPNVFFYGIFRIASLFASAFLFNLKVNLAKSQLLASLSVPISPIIGAYEGKRKPYKSSFYSAKSFR